MVGVPRLILLKNAKGETVVSYFDGTLESPLIKNLDDKALTPAVLERIAAMRKQPWAKSEVMETIVGFSVSNRDMVPLRNEKAVRQVSREDVQFWPAVPATAPGF